MCLDDLRQNLIEKRRLHSGVHSPRTHTQKKANDSGKLVQETAFCCHQPTEYTYTYVCMYKHTAPMKSLE